MDSKWNTHASFPSYGSHVSNPTFEFLATFKTLLLETQVFQVFLYVLHSTFMLFQDYPEQGGFWDRIKGLLESFLHTNTNSEHDSGSHASSADADDNSDHINSAADSSGTCPDEVDAVINGKCISVFILSVFISKCGWYNIHILFMCCFWTGCHFYSLFSFSFWFQVIRILVLFKRQTCGPVAHVGRWVKDVLPPFLPLRDAKSVRMRIKISVNSFQFVHAAFSLHII